MLISFECSGWAVRSPHSIFRTGILKLQYLRGVAALHVITTVKVYLVPCQHNWWSHSAYASCECKYIFIRSLILSPDVQYCIILLFIVILCLCSKHPLISAACLKVNICSKFVKGTGGSGYSLAQRSLRSLCHAFRGTYHICKWHRPHYSFTFTAFLHHHLRMVCSCLICCVLHIAIYCLSRY